MYTIHHTVEKLYRYSPVNLKPSDHFKAAIHPIIFGLLCIAAGVIIGWLLWGRG